MGKYLLTTLVAISLLQTAPAHSFCFAEAAAEYGVAPQLLWAISRQESGNDPYAVRRNTNGTYDYGHMQINSIWAKTLGPERWAALSDPCQSTRTGAWILSQCIQKYGYDWKAIGCYHSQTPNKRDRYAKDIARIIQRNSTTTVVQKPTAKPIPIAAVALADLVWPKGAQNATAQ